MVYSHHAPSYFLISLLRIFLLCSSLSLPSLFSSFLPLSPSLTWFVLPLFLISLSPSSFFRSRCRFSFLFFRPLFYHVQGKPINHRIPPVYCGTPGCRLEPATSPALLYSASRPSAWANVRTFANYRLVVTCTLTRCESGTQGKSNRKRKVKRYILYISLKQYVLRKVCGARGWRYYFAYSYTISKTFPLISKFLDILKYNVYVRSYVMVFCLLYFVLISCNLFYISPDI